MQSASTFEITGGNLALDLSNTLSHWSAAPEDLLRNYADLAVWGEQAGALTPTQARTLRREAEKHPVKAEAVLRRARDLRAAVYRVFSAIAARRTPATADLGVLNAELAETLPFLRITRAGEHFLWEWDDTQPRLERVLWPVVRAAADLLTAADAGSVRECASDTCAWLFLDQSKNQSRRWCDMKICGNRAKVRRFRQRSG